MTGTINFLRTVWATSVTLIMMLNLDQFLYLSGHGPEPKLIAVVLFVGSAALFGADMISKGLLNVPVIWWLVAYVALSALWSIVARDWPSAIDGFTFVISTTLYVITAILMFRGMRSNSTIWSITLWTGLFVSVLSIMIESTFPESSLFAQTGLGIQGRAAGFFLNPNSAGSAVVLLLGCILLRESRWSNLFASLVALVGVLLTYSRGGIVAWALLVLISALRGRFPRFFLPALVVAGGISASVLTVDEVLTLLNPGSQNSVNRIEWLLGRGDLMDQAASDRQWIASYAWNEFLASPLYGHGLGYMWVWGAEIGSHNMILRHMVEYGAIGLFIFPMFLACGIWSSDPSESREMRWILMIVMLMMSFFSHNLLDQGRFIVSWLAFCLVPSSQLAGSRLLRRPGLPRV